MEYQKEYKQGYIVRMVTKVKGRSYSFLSSVFLVLHPYSIPTSLSTTPRREVNKRRIRDMWKNLHRGDQETPQN